MKKFILILFILMMVTVLIGCSYIDKMIYGADVMESLAEQEDGKTKAEQSDTMSEDAATIKETEYPDILNNFSVHYIDVGQGDSILIREPGGKTMLIDTGNNGDGEMISEYLSTYDIDKIDIIIGTHPHADHIGGLDELLDIYNVGKIFMPKLARDTKTFRDLADKLREKNMKASVPYAGQVFNLGDAVCTIMSPNSEMYENTNDYSIVIKVEYGDTWFLFTGDAGVISLSEILDADYDLKADFLKVSHHGSHDGTSKEFLKAVEPLWAIISLGADNDYGHPHAETLELLDDAGVNVLRTDLNGTIIIVTDGKEADIIFEEEK